MKHGQLCGRTGCVQWAGTMENEWLKTPCEQEQLKAFCQLPLDFACKDHWKLLSDVCGLLQHHNCGPGTKHTNSNCVTVGRYSGHNCKDWCHKSPSFHAIITLNDHNLSNNCASLSHFFANLESACFGKLHARESFDNP